jgi:Cu(I)/Ag(I) efflux system membrane fusion protein
MKKYIIYIAILIAGVAAGWIVFGNSFTENEITESGVEEIWTCSMHPQIRQAEPGDCPICGMDLILLDANDNSNPLTFEMTEDAMKIANIQTTIIGSNNITSKGLKLSGKIKADETNSASIVSHISGRVEKLYISYTGEKVKKGQKIASIYSPNLITAQKELLEAYSIKEQNPSLYQATVNKLKYWKITDQQIKDIVTSEKIIESFHIYADYSGVVLNKKVSVGDYVNVGQVLFDIQNLNQLWAVFDVYEVDLVKLKKGADITFTASAIPNVIFTSTISFIDPVINPKTRTVSIRTTIKNKNNQLKPEMFLEGHVDAQNSSEKSILVPKTAVLWTGEKSVIYLKVQELKAPTFEFREVTIGESIGLNYIILDGISNGDEVVTNGAFVIDASAQLNNQSSMMNRNLLTNELLSKKLPDYTQTVPLIFKEQLNDVLSNYFFLKNALVKGDSIGSLEATKLMLTTIDKMDMKLLKGAAHMYWMKESKLLRKSTNELNEIKSLKIQRKTFLSLSSSIIDLVKVFGVIDQTYHVQFCPMAFDDGGYWLSAESTILNPYFGDEMLNCGSVELTIDKDFKNEKTDKSPSKSPMVGHNH